MTEVQRYDVTVDGKKAGITVVINGYTYYTRESQFRAGLPDYVGYGQTMTDEYAAMANAASVEDTLDLDKETADEAFAISGE